MSKNSEAEANMPCSSRKILKLSIRAKHAISSITMYQKSKFWTCVSRFWNCLSWKGLTFYLLLPHAFNYVLYFLSKNALFEKIKCSRSPNREVSDVKAKWHIIKGQTVKEEVTNLLSCPPPPLMLARTFSKYKKNIKQQKYFFLSLSPHSHLSSSHSALSKI